MILPELLPVLAIHLYALGTAARLSHSFRARMPATTAAVPRAYR